MKKVTVSCEFTITVKVSLTPPSGQDPIQFARRADAFLIAIPDFVVDKAHDERWAKSAVK